MKSPIDLFIEWISSQRHNDYCETLCLSILVHSSDFDLQSYRPSTVSYFEPLTKDLYEIKSPLHIIGKSLFIRELISFQTQDWDDIDKAFDRANQYKELGEEWRAQGNPLPHSFNRMSEFDPESFENRKEIKLNWDTFTSNEFNWEFFNQYQNWVVLRRLR